MAYRAHFKDRVAVVTGGASGIGAALAQQLARMGARVVVADRQAELADSLADAIRLNGGSAFGAELDVRDASSHKRLVDSTLARWGGIDYYFNNAGIGIGGEAAAYTTQDYDDTFDVNLRGVAYGVQAVYPVMIRQGHGHIVNTASMAGLIPSGGQAAYAASKHGVVGLSKALRVEGKAHGVRVSVLCPGVIRTPILQGGKYGRLRGLELGSEAVAAMFERLRPMAPDAFARQALEAVARDRAIIIAPRWWKLLWYLERLSPASSLALMQASHARLRKQLSRLMASDEAARPAPGSRSGVAADDASV